MSSYRTFQARSSTNCGCKYDYEGTAKHKVYMKLPVETSNTVTQWDQPASVTKYLNKAFAMFQGFQHSYAHEVNLLVTNLYDNPMSNMIHWHDDQMTLSCLPEEEDQFVVVSVSLGASMPFCIMPNYLKCPENWLWNVLGCSPGTQWTTKRDRFNQARARVACMVHRGDLMLMLGKFQRYFVHKTTFCHRWEQGLASAQYVIVKDEEDASRRTAVGGPRWNLTGRIIKYHVPGRCALADQGVGTPPPPLVAPLAAATPVPRTPPRSNDSRPRDDLASWQAAAVVPMRIIDLGTAPDPATATHARRRRWRPALQSPAQWLDRGSLALAAAAQTRPPPQQQLAASAAVIAAPAASALPPAQQQLAAAAGVAAPTAPPPPQQLVAAVPPPPPQQLAAAAAATAPEQAAAAAAATAPEQPAAAAAATAPPPAAAATVAPPGLGPPRPEEAIPISPFSESESYSTKSDDKPTLPPARSGDPRPCGDPAAPRGSGDLRPCDDPARRASAQGPDAGPSPSAGPAAAAAPARPPQDRATDTITSTTAAFDEALKNYEKLDLDYLQDKLPDLKRMVENITHRALQEGKKQITSLDLPITGQGHRARWADLASSSDGTPRQQMRSRSAAAAGSTEQDVQGEDDNRESLASSLRMQQEGISVSTAGCLEQAAEYWEKLKHFDGVGNALNRLDSCSTTAHGCFQRGVMHTTKHDGGAPLRILMPVGVAVHLLQEVENTRDNRRLLARSGLLRVSVPQAARQVKDMFS